VLAFFPCTFPDESLYSVLGRYHRLAGNASERESLRELVGDAQHVIMADLPGTLQRLADALPGKRWTADRLIDELTLFPYFAPCLSPAQVAHARQAMQGATAEGVKMRLGLLASRIGGHIRLRFCQECRRQDADAFGQCYWHRIHQLPAVWMCPLHGCPLSELPSNTVFLNRQRLLLPDEKAVEAEARPIGVTTVQEKALRRLASLSERALHAELGEWPATREACRTRAQTAGLIDGASRIRVASVDAVLAQYVTTLPAESEFAFAHSGGVPSWALKLLRKSRGTSSHPLKHLMLYDCLGEAQSPCSGVSPMMPAAQPRKGPVDEIRLRQLVESEGRSLRESAELLGVSTTTVRVEAGRLNLTISSRPKRIKTVLQQAVLADLLAGESVASVAAVHSLSLPSTYRILRMNPGVLDARQRGRLAVLKGKRRESFLAENAVTSIRQCRDYAWLWRNDRAWLTLVVKNATHQTEPSRIPTVDWAVRDRRLKAEIQAAHLRILDAPGRPRRASRTALLRATGEADTILRSANKLPLTHASLEHCSESIEQYQQRRLRWAAGQLIAEQLPTKRWRLLRMAAIRSTANIDPEFIASLVRMAVIHP